MTPIFRLSSNKQSGEKMNILLSAYSINPYKGSEDAVGWNWALTLSRKLPDSTIYIITKRFNEKDTRKGIEEFGLKNVKLIVVDVPNMLNWFREKHSVFHHGYYILWQKVAYNWVKKSGIKFDIIHHVSMGNYRICGYMYKFKDAHTIFGPVGGGQTTPEPLRSYYSTQKRYESFRDSVNRAFSKLNFYKKQINSFDDVYTVNDETKNAIENATGKKCKKLCDISINSEMQKLDIVHSDKKPVEIIYLGRLIELKGIMLLVDAVKDIKTNTPFHVSLYGDGELKTGIKEKIDEYGLNDVMTLKGKVNYSDITDIYKNADIFAHPTFRDSSGAVFVEAMANKLPIVALKQSISRDLNKNKCGLFVNTEQSKEEIINEFADKLKRLIENYDLRVKLGQNGYDYANNYLTMDNKFDTVYGSLIK